MDGEGRSGMPHKSAAGRRIWKPTHAVISKVAYSLIQNNAFFVMSSAVLDKKVVDLQNMMSSLRKTRFAKPAGNLNLEKVLSFTKL